MNKYTLIHIFAFFRRILRFLKTAKTGVKNDIFITVKFFDFDEDFEEVTP